jgi:hypothetical protein
MIILLQENAIQVIFVFFIFSYQSSLSLKQSILSHCDLIVLFY